MLKATKLLSLFLAALLIFTGCGSSQNGAAQDQTGSIQIKLGVIEPVSGSMAPLGTAEYEAIKMAIDMVNEEGGVLGKYKVEHVFADSQSNPSVGASEAERLITTEKVPILLGSYSSAIAMAISEIAERYKVPLWEMSGATDDLLTRGYQWTFRNEAMASSWGATGVDFVAEYGPEALGKELKNIKVGIVHEDGPYG
ncbi:MAG TPA: ABC transporter substrate-binding protein, partial [Clostridiales bacterium]|nr:ABC transporter substrate-binding protein [Clostridiales bacterium]